VARLPDEKEVDKIAAAPPGIIVDFLWKSSFDRLLIDICLSISSLSPKP